MTTKADCDWGQHEYDLNRACKICGLSEKSQLAREGNLPLSVPSNAAQELQKAENCDCVDECPVVERLYEEVAHLKQKLDQSHRRESRSVGHRCP